MKTKITFLQLFLFAIIVINVVNTQIDAQVETIYYVAPDGNDKNPGTVTQPFATLWKARNVVETINGSMTGDIIVNLRGGGKISFLENYCIFLFWH